LYFSGTKKERALYNKMFCLAVQGATCELIDDAEIVFAALEPVVQAEEDWNLRSFEFHCMSNLSSGGSADYTVRRMTERLRDNPDDDLAKLMICTALRNVGDPEWECMLQSLLCNTMDQFVREVGANMLAAKEAAKHRELTRPGREARAAVRAAEAERNAHSA